MIWLHFQPPFELHTSIPLNYKPFFSRRYLHSVAQSLTIFPAHFPVLCKYGTKSSQPLGAVPYHTSALHEQPTPLTWASVQSPSQLPTWVIWGSLCLTPQPESIDSVAYLPPKYIQAPRRQGLVYSTLYPHVLTQLLSCRETQNVSAEQRLEVGLSVDKRMCAKRQECKGLETVGNW